MVSCTKPAVSFPMIPLRLVNISWLAMESPKNIPDMVKNNKKKGRREKREK